MSIRRKPKLVLADEDKGVGRQLEAILKDGHALFQVGDPVNLYARLVEETPAFLLLDVKLGKTLDIIKELAAAQPHLMVIVLAASSLVSQAQAAVKAGAFDQLAKPLDADAVETVLRHAGEVQALRVRLAELEQLVGHRDALDQLLGESDAMRQTRELLALAAPADAPLLLFAPNGTKKELAARGVHERSGRKRGPFIVFGCAALPAPLLERALFGYEKGAFPGADAATPGAVDFAEGGTLFLDDVQALDAGSQQRLAKLLQSRSFAAVGGEKVRAADVRIIAAASEDLAECVKAGRFRRELQEKLQANQVKLPPLRDRRQDVPALAHRWLSLSGARNSRPAPASSAEALEQISLFEWPGNDRQLETALERAVASSSGGVIDASALPQELGAGLQLFTLTASMFAEGGSGEPHLKPIELVEKKAIIDALVRTRGHVGEASKMLGYGMATVYRKVKRYGITPEMRGKPKRGRKPKYAKGIVGAEPQRA